MFDGTCRHICGSDASRRLLGALVVLLLAAPGSGGAQDVTPCPVGRISVIFVDSHPIFDTEELGEDRRLFWAYKLANAVHMTSDEGFLLSELLFSRGDCYDPELLADSERLLRRYDFLARVDIYGLRQPDDSWHVVVDTQDEWTTELNVRITFEEGLQFRGIDLAEKNVLGRGILLGAFFIQRDEQRDIGGRLASPRVLGTRMDALVSGGKTRVGNFYEHDVFYPFLGEVGRIAGRHRFVDREGEFTYRVNDPASPFSHVLLPVDERFFEITAAGRLGEPGHLTLVGLGLSSQSLGFSDFPEGVRVAVGGDFDGAVAADPQVAAVIEDQVRFTSATRVNLLLGQRNLEFEVRRGLDALQGVQDVPVGVDVGLTVGRSLGSLFDEDAADDLFTRLRLFGGATPGRSVLILDGSLQGRQVLSGGLSGKGWRDVMGEVHALLYWQPERFARHTFFARAAGAGAWNMDLPFQITLGGSAAMRGLHTDDYPGGRRLLFSVEDRFYVGWPVPDIFDLGFTLFADLGRMWPGDVPYGSESGWQGSIGGGLRIGFPAGTRSVARLDFGFPVDGSGIGGLVFRLSVLDRLGLQRLPDRFLVRSRRHGVGPDVFTGNR